jgi:two-component system NarL family response regulator
MAERIRIMLVEDHQVVRQGLVALLSAMDDLEVVGSVGDGLDAVELFRGVQPDVTLIDLQLPKLGGVETIRRIRGSSRRPGSLC